MKRLQDRIVVITGASRGIGRATALSLAREGARIVACGRDPAALASLVGELSSLGAPAPVWDAFDLADEGAILRFLEKAHAEAGPLDILVNNAGWNPRKASIVEVSTAEWDAVCAVNLRAPFILAREALRVMIPRRSGHIVNILSTVCHHAMETMGAYTAAKRGLDGLTGVLLKEARPHGVRVSAVYPGGTDTGFRKTARPDYLRPESVGEVIRTVLMMPEDVIVHGITFRPLVESNF